MMVDRKEPKGVVVVDLGIRREMGGEGEGSRGASEERHRSWIDAFGLVHCCRIGRRPCPSAGGGLGRSLAWSGPPEAKVISGGERTDERRTSTKNGGGHFEKGHLGQTVFRRWKTLPPPNNKRLLSVEKWYYVVDCAVTIKSET
jgi:hypothetical protein